MGKVAILAALGLTAFASDASASLYFITYTGNVTWGLDETNYFGLGTNLSSVTPNSQFTLQFTYDGAVPANSFSTSESRSRDGHGNGNNPIVQTSFTLNGRTVTWGSSPNDGYNDSYGFTLRRDEYDTDGIVDNYDEIYNFSHDYRNNGSSYDSAEGQVYSITNEILNSLDLDAPLDYQVQSGDGKRGYFSSRRSGGSDPFRDVRTELTISRVTVASMSAVPEPAVWAMMVAGFGMVGGAMRRHGKTSITFA